ncbi:MAG: hypothetical protein JSW07_19685 [bacterium]|nr:MAG: hypothetical protein JSW07_19685 [bacterium]
MKKIFIFTVLIVSFIPVLVFGQLKSQDKPVQIKQEITRPFRDQFIGLSIFNPLKFSMSHSISMSYFSLGGKGISQSLYLNTMTYQIASPLLLRVQWGIQNFPYNSLAKNHPAFKSGFFLSGAELQYKPNDKFEMKLQFNSMPGYMYNPYLYENPYRPYRIFPRDEKK